MNMEVRLGWSWNNFSIDCRRSWMNSSASCSCSCPPSPTRPRARKRFFSLPSTVSRSVSPISNSFSPSSVSPSSASWTSLASAMLIGTVQDSNFYYIHFQLNSVCKRRLLNLAKTQMNLRTVQLGIAENFYVCSSELWMALQCREI
jgi:hypothetical protein